ncbi:tetratricopeptide repeat protein [Streptomyces sp. H10-C2]|uniref:tetratricopeptide repeat protein n=1 Tax=unclassified Streptomyces TaxID=2593676 RepID=UPI0024BBD311|nr:MULTISPECIES: tetratricopeptide repeat protein [unclassified Streptomyces]MDJ0347272.1 tetratricopeptide repeat protein [Streptomyces sp. PH10-H1]MDJ0375506.1 tetratricopeptide repeat protein [Streptomyces sp. H10-C2]
MRRLALIATAAVLCAGLTGFAALEHTSNPLLPSPASAPAADEAYTSMSVGAVVGKLQDKLRQQPADAASWAQLGSAYVEQARLTVDPTLYPKAEAALRRSMTLQPDTNTAAQTGMAGLANARHQFTQARTWADQAVADDPYAWAAYGALADALTQLGDDQGAQAAVQRMLNLHPSTASFTRASYTLELQGRTDEAAHALQRGLDDASNPADEAFCQHYLGELAFNTGATTVALQHYRKALALDPAYTTSLAGAARAEAALGQSGQAVADYRTAIARVPQPQYVLELGELLESLGRPGEARAQYAVLEAEQKLFAANGVVDDLNLGQYQADHGNPQLAVTLLTAEWGRRHNVLVADALGWALHRAGRDDQALPLAREANRLGWRDATLRYHRGVIEQAIGDDQAARTDLAGALSANPVFSPLRAPDARARLASLQGQQ